MKELTVRKYQEQDRQRVRDIAWDTAFMGESASAFFEGKDILSGLLTEYFTDYEPESCFVAVDPDNKVIGYLLGVKDALALKQTFWGKIFLRLLGRSIITGRLFRIKNIIFAFHCLISFLRQEFKDPDFYQEYPATLHINLQVNWRNLKIGSRLIVAFLDYLTQEKVRGVYLATLSDKASNFFNGLGFNLLYKGKRSYFRYILHRDLSIYIYAKRLK